MNTISLLLLLLYTTPTTTLLYTTIHYYYTPLPYNYHLPERIHHTLLLPQLIHETNKQLSMYDRILKLQMIP